MRFQFILKIQKKGNSKKNHRNKFKIIFLIYVNFMLIYVNFMLIYVKIIKINLKYFFLIYVNLCKNHKKKEKKRKTF